VAFGVQLPLMPLVNVRGESPCSARSKWDRGHTYLLETETSTRKIATHDCHCDGLVTNNNQVLLKAAPLKRGNMLFILQRRQYGTFLSKPVVHRDCEASSREQHGIITKRETAVRDTASN